MFILEINNGFPHGQFRFEYDDNEISVTFQADKVFKQILKDDEAALKAATADFTPIPEGTRRNSYVKNTELEIPDDPDVKVA